MPGSCVTVFGGTGFLGGAIVGALDRAGYAVRIAARHPGHSEPGESRIERLAADLRDAESVARAVEGAEAAINAVGLYVERGSETFEAIHVEGARRVAEAAAGAGVARLVHISGIGVDPASPSAYVRARARGELALREAFAAATILRPSVLFGPQDSFLNTFIGLLRVLPVFPLFGAGDTRLQPVHVDDVAAAAAAALRHPESAGRTYELGGPKTYRYRELIEMLMARSGRRRMLLPLPFALWDVQARLLGILPNPPLTRDQVALMRDDNVASPDLPGLKELGIAPTAIEDALALYPALRGSGRRGEA